MRQERALRGYRPLSDLDLAALTDELYARAAEIPFGNSDFQHSAFVEANQITPERAYRAVLLNLNQHLEALRTAYYNLKRDDVEIRRLQAKINSDQINEFDREIAAIDLEEKQIQRRYTEKLVADALHSVAHYKARMESYPAYTREQFELAEPDHYQERLSRQASGLSGAAEAIANMQSDAPRLIHGFKELEKKNGLA